MSYVITEIVRAERTLQSLSEDWDKISEESRKEIVSGVLYELQAGQRKLAEKVQSGKLVPVMDRTPLPRVKKVSKEISDDNNTEL